MTLTPPHWRAMSADDLAAVQAIADRVHPDFFEAPEVLAEKLSLNPAGCFVSQGESGIMGYVFAHPWRTRSLPALNRLIGALPASCDCLYIHDLALLAEARGSGAAQACVTLLAERAKADGFDRLSLVAVNGSIPFWQRQGFAVLEVPELSDKLAAYEPAARLMERRLC
jgi:ribosomal protein S18 acetylase RimI-like enzyme